MARQLGPEPFPLIHVARIVILNLNEWIKCVSNFTRETKGDKYFQMMTFESRKKVNKMKAFEVITVHRHMKG